MLRKIIYFTIFCGMLLLDSGSAPAGQFSVSPITMELGRGVSSGVFTVTNTGEDKINFQMSVSEWTQDAEGKDIYSETKDIIFFPKLMTVEKGEQRVVRVGLKSSMALREKTYRIFIEEIPSLQKRDAGRARISFTIRFAPPIFVRPAEIKTAGVIDTIAVDKDKISAVVKNTGNVHLKLNSISVKGKSADGAEVFSKEIAGGYVLSNVARKIEVSIPKEKCKNLSVMMIEAKTDNLTLNGKLDVQKGMCSQ